MPEFIQELLSKELFNFIDNNINEGKIFKTSREVVSFEWDKYSQNQMILTTKSGEHIESYVIKVTRQNKKKGA